MSRGEEERLAALEAQLEVLQARVTALEAPPLPPLRPSVLPAPEMALLEQLQRDLPYEHGEQRGAVSYAGAVQIGGLEYLWQVERPFPGLMALEPEPLARVLTALSSPVRITLVRELLGGPRNSQQLQAALGGVSPGQLYHHLKELRAGGVIEQHGRSDYRLAPRKIVPFLIVLAGALDLLGEGVAEAGSDERPI